MTEQDLLRMGFDKNGNRLKPQGKKKTEKSTPSEKNDFPVVGDVNADFPWAIFISGQVPSSKNSRNFSVKKNFDGTDMLKDNGKKVTVSKPSKAVSEYKKNHKHEYDRNLMKFKRMLQGRKPPFHVYYKLIRQKGITDKGGYRFDYHNMIQIVADMMTDCGMIEDDDASNVLFHPLEYGVDAENSGVVLFV